MTKEVARCTTCIGRGLYIISDDVEKMVKCPACEGTGKRKLMQEEPMSTARQRQITFYADERLMHFIEGARADIGITEAINRALLEHLGIETCPTRSLVERVGEIEKRLAVVESERRNAVRRA